MNKHPMSAAQPVFEQTLWQKERLTHSQPREQPRHRKETQQSWMKLNIDIANLNSTPTSFFIFLRRTHKTQPQQKKKTTRRWHKQAQTMCNQPLDWPQSPE